MALTIINILINFMQIKNAQEKTKSYEHFIVY